MTPTSDTIGSRIHFLRTRVTRLTRTDFAEKVGSKPVNIAVLERGIRKPSQSLLAKFQQTFQVNSNWLLTGTGDMMLHSA
jgi:transcriptional regulator with XRE-family HTH domain